MRERERESECVRVSVCAPMEEGEMDLAVFEAVSDRLTEFELYQQLHHLLSLRTRENSCHG